MDKPVIAVEKFEFFKLLMLQRTHTFESIEKDPFACEENPQMPQILVGSKLFRVAKNALKRKSLGFLYFELQLFHTFYQRSPSL